MKKVILLVILILFLTSCSKKQTPKEEEQIIYYSLFIKPTETVSFDIRDFQNIRLSEGELSPEYWNKIGNIPEGSYFRVYFWNNETYKQFITINNIKQDLNINLEISMKKGNVSMELGEKSLNIKTDGILMNPKLCYKHSLDILRVTPEQQTQFCEYQWYNYSNLTKLGDQTIITPLKEDEYRCSLSFSTLEIDDILRICEKTEENLCYLKKYERDYDYDGCIDLPSIQKTTFSLPLNIEYVTELKKTDYLTFILFDEERNPIDVRDDNIWSYTKSQVRGNYTTIPYQDSNTS